MTDATATTLESSVEHITEQQSTLEFQQAILHLAHAPTDCDCVLCAFMPTYQNAARIFDSSRPLMKGQ